MRCRLRLLQTGKAIPLGDELGQEREDAGSTGCAELNRICDIRVLCIVDT
jgi:hypothetical protein